MVRQEVEHEHPEQEQANPCCCLPKNVESGFRFSAPPTDDAGADACRWEEKHHRHANLIGDPYRQNKGRERQDHSAAEQYFKERAKNGLFKVRRNDRVNSRIKENDVPEKTTSPSFP